MVFFLMTLVLLCTLGPPASGSPRDRTGIAYIQKVIISSITLNTALIDPQIIIVTIRFGKKRVQIQSKSIKV